MEYDNQIPLLFDHTTSESGSHGSDGEENSNSADAGTRPAPQPQSERSKAEYVFARNIQIDPALHERRSFSDDDLQRAMAVAGNLISSLPFRLSNAGTE